MRDPRERNEPGAWRIEMARDFFSPASRSANDDPVPTI